MNKRQETIIKQNYINKYNDKFEKRLNKLIKDYKEYNYFRVNKQIYITYNKETILNLEINYKREISDQIFYIYDYIKQNKKYS